jgi:hypothetical protein
MLRIEYLARFNDITTFWSCIDDIIMPYQLYKTSFFVLYVLLHQQATINQSNQSTTQFNSIQSNLQTNTTNTMDSIKQGANYVSESVQQALHGTSKEANKEVAKDSDAPIGTR